MAPARGAPTRLAVARLAPPRLAVPLLAMDGDWAGLERGTMPSVVPLDAIRLAANR